MGTAQRNNRLFFGLLALLSICLGVVCLMSFTTGGVLALRRVTSTKPSSEQPSSGASQTSPPSATPLPTITVTPSPYPLISATFGPETATAPFEAAIPTAEVIETTPPEATQTPEPSQTSGPLALDAWCVPWNSKTARTAVLRVIDGVTIEVELDGKVEQVRYIGVDLLEYEQDYRVWVESTEKNKQLVEGKSALLISDQSDTDAEGRLARYVIVEGVFVNLEMVASGYAIAQSTPPNTGCDSLLLEAETQAITAGLGLWAATPTPTRTFPPPTATISSAGDVVIVKVAFRGTAWQEPEEFVEIYNSGVSPVQLEGWSVNDIKRHVFVFPRFVLGPGQYCRVYTNLYSRQHCGFSYYNPAPIWENDGDCAYLKDKTGKQVNQFCYE